MTNNISIITDDSKIILPSIHKWKGMGKGKSIKRIKDELEEILSKQNLDFPINDLELELEYKNVLKEYIRPAKLMFGGTFAEVRRFAEELEEYGNVNVYILSCRYGLINGITEIIPYDFSLEDNINVKLFDEQTNFSSNIKNILLHSKVSILLFPKKTMEYLLASNAFEDNDYLNITVCSESISHKLEEFGFEVFSRPGVIRLGTKNKERIIELIKNTL